MLTEIPTKRLEACPTPEELMPHIVTLRDAALKADPPHFDFALILSHTHAWLYWLKENWEELNKD